MSEKSLVEDALWFINDCEVDYPAPVTPWKERPLCIFFGGIGFPLNSDVTESWARDVVRSFHALGRRLEEDGYSYTRYRGEHDSYRTLREHIDVDQLEDDSADT